MTKNYYLRTLLFAFFALFTNAQQAVAQGYTEGFDSCTGNDDYLYTLPDGWSCIGSVRNFSMGTRYYKTAKPSVVYSSGSNTNDYLVTPAVSGTVTFWMYGTYKRSNGSLTVYECSDEGGKLSVGKELATFSSRSEQWTQATIDLSASSGQRLAILMSRTAIDDFAATNDGNGDTPPVFVEKKALTLTAFERTCDYALTANEQNQFTASFALTVKNTGNVALGPDEVSVSVTNDEGNALATATAADSLAADSSVVIPIEFTMDAAEGGTYYFYARENLTNTYLNNDAGTSIYRIVDVTAYRAQFALYEPGTYISVDDGELFDFGFSKTTVTRTFNLRNAGTAPLQVDSITTPEGYVVSPSEAFQVEAGSEQTISVSLVPAEGHYGQKQGSVTIAHGLGTFAFSVSGVAVDPELFFADFDDGQFPASWEVGESWSIMGGAARQQNFEGKATRLVTQKLTVAEGESLTLQARRNYSSDAALLNIYYSPDKSEDSWQLAASLGGRIPSSAAQTLTVATIPAGSYYLAFEGCRVSIDNVLGYREATDVPLLSVLLDGKTLKNGDSIDYGFTDRDSTVVLTLMNAGTGILRSAIAVGEGFVASPQTVELAAGEQQSVSITMPVVPFGQHEATLTIKSAELDDFTLTLSGSTRDPQIIYADFQDRQLPRGWQAEGKWSVMYEDFGSTNYLAECIEYEGQPQNLTTALVRIAEGDVLAFDARRYSPAEYYAPVLRVSYSPDRTNWTVAANLTAGLTTEWAQQQVANLPAGDCYLRFEGVNVQIDNVTGVHIAEATGQHLIVVTGFSVPSDAEVNHRLTISATVQNLWAESEEVSARLFIDGEPVLTAQPLAIALNQTGTFSFDYTPRLAQEAVKAQVELTYAGGTVLTEEKTFSIAPETDGTYAHIVSGIATDEQEQPLDSVTIVLQSNTGDALYQGVTAADGTFSIKVWQGILTYTLTATKQGYDDAEPQVIAFGGEDATGLTLVLVNQNPVPNGIADTQAPKKAKTADFIDLSGRRFVHPRRGIYVHNGRKTVY